MSRKRSRSHTADLSEFCSQPGEDDGVDPRLVARSHPYRPQQVDRKTLQMCSQVARVVESVLSGETADEDLSGLRVLSVIPAAHRGKLLISVTPAFADATVAPEAILAKLKQHANRIRAEVTATISRRRTPELTFAFVPALSPLSPVGERARVRGS